MPAAAPPRRRAGGVRPGIAVAVLLLGLVCAALFRLVGGTEQHAYAPGAVAPQYVAVTAGTAYRVSAPGGVTRLESRGVDVTTPRCSYALRGGSSQPLAVQAEGSGTKATTVLGTFVAPVSGDVHVDCLGWGSLFVDDADNAAPDVAGWFLVAAIALLTAGAGLCLSALRASWGARRRQPSGHDEHIDRLVLLAGGEDDSERH